ncbi:MAG: hypothetical protein WAJ85_12325 [Candidatus Baltobacteraceae bacterium]
MADAFLRLAGAIVLDTLALVVWNVGSRTPLAALRDMRHAAGELRALFAGALSLLIGLIFVAAAAVLILPAVANPIADFIPLEIFTFIVALLLEHLVGNDLRRLGGG